MSLLNEYLDECKGLIRTVNAQADSIRQAADWFAETIQAQRMVHVFGSGHSRIMVEEMWPRYGSFAGFNPIVELSLTFQPFQQKPALPQPPQIETTQLVRPLDIL